MPVGVEKWSHFFKEDVNYTAGLCAETEQHSLFGVLTHLTHEKRDFSNQAQQANSGL